MTDIDYEEKRKRLDSFNTKLNALARTTYSDKFLTELIRKRNNIIDSLYIFVTETIISFIDDGTRLKEGQIIKLLEKSDDSEFGYCLIGEGNQTSFNRIDNGERKDYTQDKELEDFFLYLKLKNKILEVYDNLTDQGIL